MSIDRLHSNIDPITAAPAEAPYSNSMFGFDSHTRQTYREKVVNAFDDILPPTHAKDDLYAAIAALKESVLNDFDKIAVSEDDNEDDEDEDDDDENDNDAVRLASHCVFHEQAINLAQVTQQFIACARHAENANAFETYAMEYEDQTKSYSNTFRSGCMAFGSIIGMVIGAVAGFFCAGPVGALVGGMAGGFAGGYAGFFATRNKTTRDNKIDAVVNAVEVEAHLPTAVRVRSHQSFSFSRR